VTKQYSELGVPVLDEGFMDMPHTLLHPQVCSRGGAPVEHGHELD
jgi:hypothetical protein